MADDISRSRVTNNNTSLDGFTIDQIKKVLRGL